MKSQWVVLAFAVMMITFQNCSTPIEGNDAGQDLELADQTGTISGSSILPTATPFVITASPTATPVGATPTPTPTATPTPTPTPAATKTLYRLFNPYSGNQYISEDLGERNGLIAYGWADDGALTVYADAQAGGVAVYSCRHYPYGIQSDFISSQAGCEGHQVYALRGYLRAKESAGGRMLYRGKEYLYAHHIFGYTKNERGYEDEGDGIGKGP